MAKKNKSKAPKKVPEDTTVQEEKPPSAKAPENSKSKTPEKSKSKTREKTKSKKPGNEIDDIFAAKKRKKIEPEKSGKGSENGVGKPMKIRKKKRIESSDDDGFGEPSSRPKKKTGDGFVIYSEEELGINKADAGGTPLCPFDCSCCF
ncbi:hypothetical protein UlMin_034968 [Ulmus minor]